MMIYVTERTHGVFDCVFKSYLDIRHWTLVLCGQGQGCFWSHCLHAGEQRVCTKKNTFVKVLDIHEN